MDEIIREFLVESQEHLNRLDSDLIALEKDPHAVPVLAEVFRIVHSIKGSAGFLGFSILGAVTHAGEGLLSRLRDGALVLNPESASALLRLVDAMREILASVEATGREGHHGYEDLIGRLQELQQTGASISSAEMLSGLDLGTERGSAGASDLAGSLEETVQIEPKTLPLPEEEPPTAQMPRAMAAFVLPGDPDPVLTEPPQPLSDTATVKPAPPSTWKPPAQAVADTTLRVDVELLDKLMTLVGELVLARNQILQHTAFQADARLQAVSQRLNLITTELQEGMMRTRMQPIGNIWNKLPRMVRDLALECGKQVRLELEGEATELDKTVIEAIKDPLTHLVRNAVDHGIELAGTRLDLGKPVEGVLSLRAFHEGGQVNIEIQDDGAGIDPERIKRKALERGIVGPQQVARMTERELLNLIFLPGFSTAEQLTLVSGRGVGMDVVKTGIEMIGGTLDLQSECGRGTTIRIKIPLTLAIIKALIVSSGGDRYAIPQASLLELVRLEGGQAGLGVEMFHGAPVYRYRGRLLPLVDLDRLLSPDEPCVPFQHELLNIVVLQADGQTFGLVVDRVSDAQEIVVRPLASQLNGIACFSGATIMGDGRIALILDVAGLARHAGVLSQTHQRDAADTPPEAAVPATSGEALLLLRGTDGGRMAIPLGQVARLETFARSAVEDVGGRAVVPYRGQILQLIDVAATLPRGTSALASTPANPAAAVTGLEATVPVVVCAPPGLTAGLVFERVLDIVDLPAEAQSEAGRPGVLFTTVVGSHVTEVLDIEAVIRAAGPVSGSPLGAVAPAHSATQAQTQFPGGAR